MFLKQPIENFIRTLDSDFKRKQVWMHNNLQYEQELYDFNDALMTSFEIGSYFPQYWEHCISSEILVTKFFGYFHMPFVTRFLSYSNALGPKNLYDRIDDLKKEYMIDDEGDFEHMYYNLRIEEFEEDFYDGLCRCYSSLCFIYQERMRFMSWFASPRLRWDIDPMDPDPYKVEKRTKLLDKITLCNNFITRMYEHIEQSKKKMQKVWRKNMKKVIDEIGQSVWKTRKFVRKPKPQVVFVADKRPLWAFNSIADIVLMYLVETEEDSESLCKKQKV